MYPLNVLVLLFTNKGKTKTLPGLFSTVHTHTALYLPTGTFTQFCYTPGRVGSAAEFLALVSGFPDGAVNGLHTPLPVGSVLLQPHLRKTLTEMF